MTCQAFGFAFGSTRVGPAPRCVGKNREGNPPRRVRSAPVILCVREGNEVTRRGFVLNGVLGPLLLAEALPGWGASWLQGNAPDLGVDETGSLQGCDSSKRNCVSTSAPSSDIAHFSRVWQYTKSDALAIKDVLDVLSTRASTAAFDSGGVNVVERTDSYLYVQFSGKVARFVDDVEFYAAQGHLYYRAASRAPRVFRSSGVNRRRINYIGKQLASKGRWYCPTLFDPVDQRVFEEAVVEMDEERGRSYSRANNVFGTVKRRAH